MTDTERAVTWGLLGLIAYELWRGQGGGVGGCNSPSSLPSSGDSTPVWVSQLAEVVYGEDFSTPTCGIFGRCGG